MIKEIRINLVGAGMGSDACLTGEVKNIIHEADMVFGAARLSRPFSDSSVQKVVDTYRVSEMIEVLENMIRDSGTLCCSEMKSDPELLRAVFVFSGDSGFYSGAEGAYKKLKEWADTKLKEGLRVSIDIKAGISSIAYLASRLKVSWQDAQIHSIHGRDFDEEISGIIDSVRYCGKTFILLSGAKDVARLADSVAKFAGRSQTGENGASLGKADISTWIEMYLGYRLSYDDEELIKIVFTDDGLSADGGLSADDGLSADGIRTFRYSSESDTEIQLKEGLYTAFIYNPSPEIRPLSYGIPTDRYIREQGVPITKEEIREIVLSKLRLYAGCTFYDLGSGTGGVTVDAARISPDVRVVSVEKKPERAELIRRNVERFGLFNVTVLVGDSADVLAAGMADSFETDDVRAVHSAEAGGMEEFDARAINIIKKYPPDRVFIGGTEGRLRDIINLLRITGRKIRVCMTAITERTKSDIMNMLGEGIITDPDIVEVGVSRLIYDDDRYVMKDENRIMIAAFDLKSDVS